jgi:hypothetical protein
MMSPAQATLWQTWRRHRYGVAASCAYLLICAIVIQFLPEHLLQVRFGDAPFPLVAQYLGTPCFFVLLYVAAMFSITGEASNDFDFATHRFVLPVRTRQLVAWPMMQGCVALACAWWLIAALVLRPAGIAAPWIWPASLMAANLTALQAIAWIPLAQNWVRIAIATPAFMVLNTCVLLIAVLGVPESILTVLCLSALPVNYVVALHGVSMGRRGDVYDWRAWQKLVARVAAWRKPAQKPFSSAQSAQLWFECRGHAWVLPAFVAAMMTILIPLVAAVGRDDVAQGWRLMAMVGALPILMASVLGPQHGNRDVWSKIAMGPFLGTRPISSASLVECKVKMCAITAGITWAILWVTLPVALLSRPGFGESVWDVIQGAGSAKAAAIGALVIVLPVFFTWLQLVSSLWLGLTGREWVATTAVFGFLGVFAAAGGAGFWLYLHQEYLPLARALEPWLLGGMVSLKIGAGVAVLAALLRSRLVSTGFATAMAGGWIALVAILVLLTMWLSPIALPRLPVTAGAILLVPFSRLAVAPLAVAWNRHR